MVWMLARAVAQKRIGLSLMIVAVGGILARLLSTIRIALVALWTFFWTALALLIYLVSRGYRVPLTLARRIWAPGALAILGARLKVEGVERIDFTKAYLLVANHTSQLDIPVLFGALPTPLRFLAKEELRRIPLVGQFISAMGMIFIDRDRSESARGSIDRLADSLQQGNCLMAFPEGTRSRNGELRDFKTGVFVAAIKSGVPVVPILIEGAASILPSGTVEVRPGAVRVRAGEPLATAHLTLDDRRALADLAHSKMSELQSTEVSESMGESAAR